jgi:hypothetical protein
MNDLHTSTRPPRPRRDAKGRGLAKALRSQSNAQAAWSSTNENNAWSTTRTRQSRPTAGTSRNTQGVVDWGIIDTRADFADGWAGPTRQEWDAPAEDWTASWDGAAPVHPDFNSAEELVGFWRQGVAGSPGRLAEFIEGMEKTGKGAWQSLDKNEWKAVPPEAVCDSPASEETWRSANMSRPKTLSDAGVKRNKKQVLHDLGRKGIHWDEPPPPLPLAASVHEDTPALAWVDKISNELKIHRHRHEDLHNFWLVSHIFFFMIAYRLLIRD